TRFRVTMNNSGIFTHKFLHGPAIPEAMPHLRSGALILIAATPGEARLLAGHATTSRLSVTIRG
ncbi:hypothetical protein ABZ634_09885, partial [Nocardiopsis alba]